MVRVLNRVPARELLLVIGILSGAVCSRAFHAYYGVDWLAALFQ
jgi:hypothetical protein